MSQDTESFEQLRRLLALKRHEQPPPGYFNDFSRQVIVRIKAGERGEPANVLERLFLEAPWLQRLLNAFETRPILAGACGVAVCGLMIAGVLYSDSADVSSVARVPISESGTSPATFTSLTPEDQQPFIAVPVATFESTGAKPILTGGSPNGSLLEGLQQLKAERTSFAMPVVGN